MIESVSSMWLDRAGKKILEMWLFFFFSFSKKRTSKNETKNVYLYFFDTVVVVYI